MMEQTWNITDRRAAASMSDRKRYTSESADNDIIWVGVKHEDTLSVCCVCCKILSCHTSGLRKSNSGQVAVCGKVCFRVLDQTMAFMQGFVLCKLLCDFVFAQSTTDQNAKLEPIQDSHSSSSSLYSVHSLVDQSMMPHDQSSAAENSDVMKFKSYEVEDPHCCVSALPTSLQTAACTKADPRQRERQGTKVTSTVAEDTIAAFSYEAEVPVVMHVGEKTRAIEATAKAGISPDTHNSASHSDRNQHQSGSVLCGECGVAFKTKKSMKIHFSKNHKKSDMKDKKKEMTCHICGKLCVGQVGLTLHIRNQHAGEKAAECEVCGERFFNTKMLKRHRARIHNKLHGMCHICGKHFKYANTLRDHIRSHTGIKRFVCELCGKSFMRLSNLCDHRRDHCYVKQMKALDQPVTGEQSQWTSHPKLKALQCRECKKTLENFKAWKAHKEEHRLNRSVICQICGKSFKTQSSLNLHKKLHQEKKFQCDVCSKQFTYKCNMERHRETHNEDRPYKCDFCQKTFKTELVLDRHKIMHMEDRQYKCHICGRGLTCMNNLKKHLRVMHPGSDT
ncbi:hypothetical protein BaRGS_00014976 [Batillaria attramentaria]|uniref:C2H2-type domain-containing protein n=1 Tax=Batillaria attramentaria TaxID=370345 RepID=A0ABD0L2Z0_9CAEN